MLFSTVTVSFYTSTKSAQGFHFLTILTNTCYFVFFIHFYSYSSYSHESEVVQRCFLLEH